MLPAFLLLIWSFSVHAVDKEVLPENCHCRDWYGGCKGEGETWTDDETWAYRCASSDGGPAMFTGCMTKDNSRMIPPGANQTVDSFWFSCESDDIRLKYQQESKCSINGSNYHVGEEFRDGIFHWLCLETGRWNETRDWVLLRIGQVGYNGLIRHTCDRYKDNPGIVQYHAEIRDDVPVKSPTNKGRNQNFPEFVDNRLKQAPIPWTHQNVAFFIASKDGPNTKIRYLPASRGVHQPSFFSS